MALKETIETWYQACCLLDKGQFPEALSKLQIIQSPSAKVYHNIGCTLFLMNSVEDALKNFQQSIEKDKHLALSYFTIGLCQHQQHRYLEALDSFTLTRSLIRGTEINYKQLGAPISLTAKLVGQCIVILKDCLSKKKHSPLPNVQVLDCIFRPPKAMVDNLVKQDFLGKPKIVSSTEPKDGWPASTQDSTLQPNLPLDGVVTKKCIPSPPNRPPPRFPTQHRSEAQQIDSSISKLKAHPSKDHMYITVIPKPVTIGNGDRVNAGLHKSASVGTGDDRWNVVIPPPPLYSAPSLPHEIHTKEDNSVTAVAGYSVPSHHPVATESLAVQVRKEVAEVSPYLVTDLAKLFQNGAAQPSAISQVKPNKSAGLGQPCSSDIKECCTVRSDSPSGHIKKPTRPPPPRRELNL